MLKEDWESTDILTYSYLNTIYNKFKELYLRITDQELSLTNKNVGDFLFVEELNLIENALYSFNSSFNKKKWYNITKLDYTDLNRWCTEINEIERKITETLYIITEDGNQIITEDSLILVTEGE